MRILEEKILKEGKILPGHIIKVDGFLNHRVDTVFLNLLSEEFKKFFNIKKVSVILTAEASGIPLATVCACNYGIPLIFAKKAKSDNIENGLYKSEIFSYTYKKTVTMILSKEWLHSTDNVLIIDDFMAKGNAIQGLIDIVGQAGASIEGIGVAIEKGFQGGGDALRQNGYNYHALSVIDEAEPNHIKFRAQT